jgi:histone H3/H4
MLAARKAMKKHEDERDRIGVEVAEEIERAVEAALEGVQGGADA